MIPWVTVETLGPEGISVASVGDVARGFADWRRVLQRQLARTPALYDGLNTREIIGAIKRCVSSAEDIDRVFDTRSGPHRLLLRPVFGPAGEVHAVRLWAGPEADTVPPLPAAAGVIWDLDSQTLAQPAGITALAGIAPEEYVPRMSIAEFFQRVSAFDRHADVLDLLYHPDPRDTLQFDVSVIRTAGRATRWRISARARVDERTHGAWWLIEDITTGDEPAAGPTLESIGLREAHRRAGNHLAVVQLAHSSISHWLTEPASWVRWDYLFHPVDVFHPEDRPRLAELESRVLGGDGAEVTVRMLNYDGDYTPTTLLLYPYPGFTSHGLTIAEFRPAAGTPAHGLLPAARGDLARISADPLGYDDQLRYRLAGGMRHHAV